MSNRIRNLAVKYGVDISEYLDAADNISVKQKEIEKKFRDTANSMDNWQTSANGLKARTQSLSEQIQLQKDKVNSLKQAYDKVVQSKGADNEAAQKLQSEYVNASKYLDKMNRDLGKYQTELYDAAVAEGKTGKEAEAMGGKLKQTSNTTINFKGQIKDMAKNLIGSYGSIAGMVALLVKLGGAFFDAIKNGAKFGDEVMKSASLMDITTEEVQKLTYASNFVEVSLEETGVALSKVTKSVAAVKSGNDEAAKAYKRLGVNVEDSNGKLRGNYDIFTDVIDALASMTDEQEANQISLAIFKKGYADLKPLIESGKGALQKYGKEAEDMGIILDDLSIRQLGMLQDQLDKTTAQTKALSNEMAVKAAPAAINLARSWNSFLTALNKASDGLTNAGVNLGIQMSNASDESKKFMLQHQALLSAATNGALIMGWGYDEMKAKAKELNDYYIGQGLSTNEAWIKSMTQIASGYDLAGTQAYLYQLKIQELDDAVNEATADMLASQDKYATAVESRYSEIMDQAGGIFDAFPEKAKTSGKKLMKILEGQVNGLQKWSDNLKSLEDRGVEKGLIDELRKKGPATAGEVEALNKMTGSELDNYVELWYQKSVLARDRAITEMEPLAGEVGQKIKDVETAIQNRDTYMEQVGAALAQSIADGITSKTSAISKAAQEAVKKALNDARNLIGLPSVNYGTSGDDNNRGYPHSAAGAIFTQRTITEVAEAGDEEVLIPMNSAPRSLELLQYAMNKMAAKNNLYGAGSGVSLSTPGSSTMKSAALPTQPIEIIVQAELTNYNTLELDGATVASNQTMQKKNINLQYGG